VENAGLAKFFRDEPNDFLVGKKSYMKVVLLTVQTSSILNKQQISGGRACLHCNRYTTIVSLVGLITASDHIGLMRYYETLMWSDTVIRLTLVSYYCLGTTIPRHSFLTIILKSLLFSFAIYYTTAQL